MLNSHVFSYNLLGDVMLKSKAIDRIFMVSLIAFIFFIIATFILDDNNIDSVKTNNICNSKVYTINEDNYVVSTMVYVDENKSLEEKVYDLLSMMIKENNKNYLLPSYFSPILPNGTEINDVVLENDILKIYFSHELLDISDSQSSKMIESLIYTLTEFDDVLGIEIYVDNNMLRYIPNSVVSLPTILTRDYGINKVYDLDSNMNIKKVYLTYYDENDEIIVTKYLNDEREDIEIIIEELSNYSYLNNVVSYMNNDILLESYTINDDSIDMVFNTKIDDKLLLGQLSNSIFLNYDKSIIRYINNGEVFYDINKN